MKSYKELDVWQKSIDLAVGIYNLTESFPSDEKYALTNQMRRAAVSIPSNIAEGFFRDSTKDYIKFLYIARGSRAELETQILLAYRLEYINSDQYDEFQNNLETISRMLNSMISRLSAKLK